MHRRYDSKHIPIELLRTFVAIADLGSYTKAAQELELTQPAISAQMKRLQQLMGGEVFVKSTAGFSVSAKGSMLEVMRGASWRLMTRSWLSPAARPRNRRYGWVSKAFLHTRC
jgi:hypothetical protein